MYNNYACITIIKDEFHINNNVLKNIFGIAINIGFIYIINIGFIYIINLQINYIF